MARRRVDLREAAEILGTSVDAVRKRIARETLDSEKVDGKVYVWLDDGAPRSDTDALISEIHAHNETLRRELEAERNAHAETRRLLAGALERIPALDAPHEAPHEAETDAGGEPRGTGPGATGRPEAPEERVSWWRRFFGIG